MGLGEKFSVRNTNNFCIFEVFLFTLFCVVLLHSCIFAMVQIETFPNPAPKGRRYTISHSNPEFTSVCPKTGLPDFGTITVKYIPDETCIELKALKYYFLDFRNKGIFYEAVTNQILDDLVAACDPLEMDVVAEWMPRGGISSVIVASHKK